MPALPQPDPPGAPTSPDAVPADIELASPADAPGIARLSRDGLEHGLSRNWTADRVLQARHDDRTGVVVGQLRGWLQGFGGMHYAESEAHLVQFAVAPGARHQGLGRQVMHWLDRSARVAGVRRLRRDCRAQDRSMIAFYQVSATLGRVADRGITKAGWMRYG